MSRSTFTFNQYSVTGGTSVVEVVCGLLLKGLKENGLELTPAVNEIAAKLDEYISVDHGFIRIELPGLMGDDLMCVLDVVSKCVSHIQSWGACIPLDQVLKFQSEGFLLKESKYTQDMPTQYILEFFRQLKRMLELPVDYDLTKDNQSANYPIEKD